ncbi:SDR family NAD(P)-dependent oxidoreductase [Salinispira pacifica]
MAATIDLAGKTALVTGGSRGIGAAVCKALAAAGAEVLVHYHRARDAALTVAAATGAREPENAVFRADIADPAEIEKLFAEIHKTKRRVDILVNNAGAESVAGILDLELSEWDRVVNINLRGPFLCSKYGARQMLGTGGVIINISSIHDQVPRKGLAHYSAAKAGLAMLTRSLALELAEHGIRAITVSPGAIETEMNSDEIARVGRDLFNQNIPAGRIGTAEEIAGLVVFLASDLASYITGTTCYADGGYMLSTVHYDPRVFVKKDG